MKLYEKFNCLKKVRQKPDFMELTKILMKAESENRYM